jgi:hypothetical protein
MEHDIEQSFLELFPDLIEQIGNERRRLHSI